jgi:hypothetical protein
VTAFTGWAIDRDYLGEDRVGYGQDDEDVVLDDAEIWFPRSITVRTDLKASDVSDAVRFRVLDDDGEVYYGGAISRSWLEGEECLAFAPLTFATADAGAIDLQYRDDAGKWVTL